MVTAKNVADYFALCTMHPNQMTNMRANKLAYYAQAWALVRFGKPLFDDVIEAWEHGPVIPSIYRSYSAYGSNPIPAPTDVSFIGNFSEEEKQLLNDVAREYDGLSTWHLRNLSHSKDEPWLRVYDPNKQHTVIPIDLIAECFREMAPIPKITLDDVLEKATVIDAIPIDWDDGGWDAV